jgi:serine/threonine protein kinase
LGEKVSFLPLLVQIGAMQPASRIQHPGGPRPVALPEVAVTPEAAGRYERRGILGAGAVGFVELVFDRHLGREVALKRLRPGLDGDAARRFLKEARVGAMLSHPGIVPVYELGRRPDGGLYYTMMRVQGRTLAQALQGAELAERLSLLPHLVAACYTLAFAHTHGVIHRDIKPDNLMLGDHGETRVVDWGLCCERGGDQSQDRPLLQALEALRHASGTRTLVGAPIGTPAYMPPEQARGQLSLIDARADVYAVGAILYEILTGEPPFPGASALHILTSVLSEPLQPPESLEPEAPRELCAIATRALAKDPAARYPDMLALARDLLAFRTGRVVDAHVYDRRARVQRWLVRRRAPAVALASAVAAGALGWWLG